MSQKQFILDTLLPYKLDRSTCATNINLNCVYLDSNTGNKCAIGKHMKKGVWQQHKGSVLELVSHYKLSNILTEEANSQNLSLDIWGTIQSYHDSLARKLDSLVNPIVKLLETDLNIDLSELYI